VTGTCVRCGQKTATLPGTDSNRTRQRRTALLAISAAVNGYRLGYVKENTDPPRLLCAECLSYMIPDSVAA
jgi:hypothetical protein